MCWLTFSSTSSRITVPAPWTGRGQEFVLAGTGSLCRLNLAANGVRLLVASAQVFVHFRRMGEIIGDDGIDIPHIQRVVHLDDLSRRPSLLMGPDWPAPKNLAQS